MLEQLQVITTEVLLPDLDKLEGYIAFLRMTYGFRK
jgi:hypothetical protein